MVRSKPAICGHLKTGHRRKPGFQDWVREVSFSGGTITLNAQMATQSGQGAVAADAYSSSEVGVAEAARLNKAAKEAEAERAKNNPTSQQ